ncbi:hypothetical protein SDC9_129976 [bioreactor metagenome]|uniref:Uncharacterized protein n=1 Tax=bioreactor metagenome TaxID=1076179 RepID=A0A645D118_9ZZZZ
MDPLEPVAHRVGVHEQGSGGGLDRQPLVEEAGQRLQQPATGVDQWAVDVAGQGAPGVPVAGQRPLRQQVVGMHRTGCGRPPGRRPQARQGGPGAATGLGQVVDPRADHHRALAEALRQWGDDGQRVGIGRQRIATQDDHQPVAVHRREAVQLAAAGHPPGVLDLALGLGAGGGADHHQRAGGGPPAQGRDPRHHRVVDLAAHDRVDDGRLLADVPGAAHLRRRRIDLGGGEGDVPAVLVQRGVQIGPVGPRHQLIDLGVDGVDDAAGQVDRLLQRHVPGQVPGRPVEDLHLPVRAPLAEPVDEPVDARAGDQGHRGPVLRTETSEPLVARVDLRDGGGGHLRRHLAQAPGDRGTRTGRGELDPGQGHGQAPAPSWATCATAVGSSIRYFANASAAAPAR